MNTPPIEVHDLTVSYNNKPVLWDIDFCLPEGKSIAIIGPNGAGKSTLLKAMMGFIPTASGFTRFFGAPPDKKRGVVSYVPQRSEVDWDFPISVFECVLMGRYGHLRPWQRPSRQDKSIAENALKQVEMWDYRSQQIGALSGGQQQRTFIARALAQQASLYLLDEPFAGVDAATEKSLVTLFNQLKSEGKTLVVVHHDLSTVTDYYDEVLLLNMRLIAQGAVETTFTQDNIQKAYGGRLGLLTEVTEKLSQTDAPARLFHNE